MNDEKKLATKTLLDDHKYPKLMSFTKQWKLNSVRPENQSQWKNWNKVMFIANIILMQFYNSERVNGF